MVTSMEERQNGVLAIDIGAGTTDFVLYRNGAPHTTGVVAVGGGHFTNDISLGLRLTEGQAEKLKVGSAGRRPGPRQEREGLARRQFRDRRPPVLPAGDRERHGGARVGAPRGRQEEARATPSRPRPAPAGVVLTGGGAKLPALAECAAKVFNAPARLGEAPSWVAENLRDPGYHTALGILYYGVSSLGDRAVADRRKGGFLRNVTRLFAST
jgi:cell division protein FtsA